MDPSPLHIKKSYKKNAEGGLRRRQLAGRSPARELRWSLCAGPRLRGAGAKRNVRPANAGRDAAVPPGGVCGRSRKRSAFERPVRSAEPPRGASTSVGNCRRNRESARAFPRREASLECGDSSPPSSRTLPLYGHVRKQRWRASCNRVILTAEVVKDQEAGRVKRLLGAARM